MNIVSRFPSTSRFFFLLLPIFLAAFAFRFHIEKSLPKKELLLQVKGLTAPVSLTRDEHGVAYIEGKTASDVYFAMGFAHASDRLWQLEIQRRIARGELSEIFGRSFLKHDIWMKTLGIYESAESAWDALSPEAKESLLAYSKGVSAWIEMHDVYPVEFGFFDIKPEKWTPADSLAWIKVFALSLAGDMYDEITKSAARQILTSDQFKDLYFASQSSSPLSGSYIGSGTINLLSAFVEQKKFSEGVLNIGGPNVGSNAWAISGRHTRSGQAILANDPHLSLQIPSIWYVADQRSPGFSAVGMSLVGLPIIIFGRNSSIAWGGTNMMADTQDLYLEQVHPTDPNMYLGANGQWKKFKTVEKTVHVRPDFPSQLREALKPVSFKVRHTDNGPVISEQQGSLDATVSLAWTALAQDDTSYEAFYRLNYAKNWSAFKASLTYLHAPVLNMLYIDRKHIGYLGAGKIPVRAQGDGTEIVPGWQTEFRWKGFIPSDEMPQKFDPPSGIIVSANDDPTSHPYPYHISNKWAPSYRANRIKQLIAKQIDSQGYIDIEGQGFIQQDQFDAAALALAKSLSVVQTKTKRLQGVIEGIKSWDGYLRRDSQTALLFSMWLPELNRQIFEDEFTGSYLQGEKSAQLRAILPSIEYEITSNVLNKKTLAHWCDDISTEPVEQCLDIINSSFEKTVSDLDKYLGENPEKWMLGRVQMTKYEHLPFSQIRVMDKVFERRVINGGSGNSINVAPARFDKTEGLEQKIGASFRQIISIGEDDIQHLYMNSTGQSGNVLSEHYDDMVGAFNAVSYYRLPSSKPKIMASNYSLVPMEGE